MSTRASPNVIADRSGAGGRSVRQPKLRYHLPVLGGCYMARFLNFGLLASAFWLWSLRSSAGS
jgi:hypothetical protein